jgi:hypothetical protein
MLYDGKPTQGGKLILPLTLAANESARDAYATHGIPYESGLWAPAQTGSVGGAIFVVPAHLWGDWAAEAVNAIDRLVQAGP